MERCPNGGYATREAFLKGSLEGVFVRDRLRSQSNPTLIGDGRDAMRFPTLSRFGKLLERYSLSSFPGGFYSPKPPAATPPPCAREQPLCSLGNSGPRRTGSPGVEIRWMNAR
jgi:hypothetical protein